MTDVAKQHDPDGLHRGAATPEAPAGDILATEVSGHDRCEQLLLVGEVFVGGIVRHARSAADLSKGDRRDAAFFEELGGSLDEGFTGCRHQFPS
jgi:hypothetical protein